MNGYLLVKSDDLSLLLLQTNHDTSHLFTDYLRTGKKADLKEARTIADREIINAIVDCEKFVASFGDVIKLTGILKNRLNFIFHEIADEAAVYKVFEVLNSRGLPVPWIDRLKSALMGVVFERKQGNSQEIIKELHQIWGDIYRTIGLRQGLSNETLKFAATLKDKVRRSKVLGEEQAVALFKTIVGDDPVKAVDTSKWILQVARAVDQFMQTSRRSKAVASIAHARLVAVAIILAFDGNTEAVLHTWERVSFRVFGLCDKDARTKVGSYVKLAWDCINSNLERDEVCERLKLLTEDDDELSLTWAVEHIRETNCYENWEEELRYLLYRHEEYLAKSQGIVMAQDQWNRIWEESASNTIEHILPQSHKNEEVEDEAPEIHWLGNLMLLPPRLNSSLGAKSPHEKSCEYRATGLLAANEVAEAIEKKGAWTKDDIIARENRIIRWLEQEWF